MRSGGALGAVLARGGEVLAVGLRGVRGAVLARGGDVVGVGL
ncbi:hypothetical protein [Dactylosporangium sp. NPDC000521]